jgi:CheY-like chemotaxis protein
MAPTVLIVDDDPLMLLLYRNHLERGGYRMITAKNGLEALEVATQEAPSLIFMDVMMEGMDGLSALRELKKREATKEIPVVIITSASGQHNATKREAEQSGAASFLTKPLSPMQFLNEVKRLVPSAAPGEPTAPAEGK